MDLSGELFIGYPVMASPRGHRTLDAMLLSQELGLLCFDLIEGGVPGDYKTRQDSMYTMLSARLLPHSELVVDRRIQIPIITISYAPAIETLAESALHPLVGREGLGFWLASKQSEVPDLLSLNLYKRALSAVQTITAIRRTHSLRPRSDHDNRSERLRALEHSIATLDAQQSKAVIETATGVQRIRGLAGSGKTIVLALKAAYLHAQNPEWQIAITFYTRSLKAYFSRLITYFSIEQTGQEPNWDNLHILNAWGAPGSPERNGIYHDFCRRNGLIYLDFRTASRKYSMAEAFPSAVAEALAQVSEPKPYYDAILVDEAQDLPPPFLRLCYEILRQPKRLVYAYDELQNLTHQGLPTPEEIFGTVNGLPRVTFGSDDTDGKVQDDIILSKCYRNSRPLLVTAHGLGFGIYRTPPKGEALGLIQMFDHPQLWLDIGYSLKEGTLAPGKEVTLVRTSETSPSFLEAHSGLDDLLVFRSFHTERQQAQWVATSIAQNLGEDNLRYDDIIIINPNPRIARQKLGRVREALLTKGIPSHIAGVDTDPDEFHKASSITCTGIFRAKGNEAAMVYVINSDDCHTDAANLARKRNQLFTAITRSKAWVRVTGVGRGMEALIEEYVALKQTGFELTFRYPTEEERSHLNIVHRDMSASQEELLKQSRHSIAEVIQALREGHIRLEDVDADLSALIDLITRIRS